MDLFGWPEARLFEDAEPAHPPRLPSAGRLAICDMQFALGPLWREAIGKTGGKTSFPFVSPPSRLRIVRLSGRLRTVPFRLSKRVFLFVLMSSSLCNRRPAKILDNRTQASKRTRSEPTRRHVTDLERLAFTEIEDPVAKDSIFRRQG